MKVTKMVCQQLVKKLITRLSVAFQPVELIPIKLQLRHCFAQISIILIGRTRLCALRKVTHGQVCMD